MLSTGNFDSFALERWNVIAPGLFVAPSTHISVNLASGGNETNTIQSDGESGIARNIRLVSSGADNLSGSLLHRIDFTRAVVNEHGS